MRPIHRPARAGAIAVLGLAMTALTGAAAPSAMAAAAHPAMSHGTVSHGTASHGTVSRGTAARYVPLRGSVTATRNRETGSYRSQRMTIEVSLAPRDQAGLSRLLRGLYTRGSTGYHRWLARGQFDARFGPSAAVRAAVGRYLAGQGLTVHPAASPFLVAATGSSARVSAAFRTTLRTYISRRGVRYFANSSPVRLPATLAANVLGVLGLSDTARPHDHLALAKLPRQQSRQPAAAATAPVSCTESPYPTDAQIFGLYLNGISFPAGYGAGPGCSGLTPSQLNSIYDAPSAGPAGQGKGVTLAVFELTAYLKSDIRTWGHTVYGSSFTPNLANIDVDGGPRHPVCPSGDTCQPASQAFSGDIEADADIETQLALAPDASKIEVYEAPNDFTDQTTLDLYSRIAGDDTASVVSSSWGECENDLGAASAMSENVIFEQMAAQGQSMFASAGDDGAFDCLDDDGTSIVNVDDPEAQPWVTSVGGTSLESDNPGMNPSPPYPANGVETVWNVDNLCNTSADEGGEPGLFWCGVDGPGAGGGGSSQFWGRPFYQAGPGVNNPFSTTGNGTTQCSFAATGTPCREVPDISANADEWTPYAEYCTGNAHTPGSSCGQFSGSFNPPGWFGIGGTSLSSPLWSAIIADRDSYQGARSGNINPLLYLLLNLDPGRYFHDITGIGPNQAAATNNGLFPTTPGYDEATGIGTPKMAPLITGTF
jgi:subtilase family serine protease